MVELDEDDGWEEEDGDEHYLGDVVELDEDDGWEEEDGGGDEQEHVAQVQEPARENKSLQSITL